MRSIWLGILIVLLSTVGLASAAPVVNLARYYLAKNGTQSFTLPVSDSANAATEDIEGMTFTLQIGAGTGSAPAIGSVNFLTNTIWTGHVSAGSVGNPAGGNDPQFQSFSLVTDDFGDFVNANGTLATFTLNGMGAALGDYPLKINFTKEAGSDTQFFNGQGANVPSTLGNGTLTIVAPGDFTRDNHVNSSDVAAMLSALTDLNAYKTSTGLDDAGLLAIGDLNADHAVNNADLQSLLTLLKNGGGSLATVPEPASWSLMSLTALGGFMLFRRRNSALVRPFRKRISPAGRSG